MKSSAVTIKQLSSLSGYSISTVSKALNNKLEISKATRETIKTIAKQHNYVPNNYAVSLRIQKTESIAVILPVATKQCYSHVLYHLQKSAENIGYRILFYQSFNSYDKELKYLRSLNDGSIDGVIIVTEGNRTASDYINNSIPLEIIKITENQSLEEIEKFSVNSLAKLLQLQLI